MAGGGNSVKYVCKAGRQGTAPNHEKSSFENLDLNPLNLGLFYFKTVTFSSQRAGGHFIAISALPNPALSNPFIAHSPQHTHRTHHPKRFKSIWRDAGTP